MQDDVELSKRAALAAVVVGGGLEIFGGFVPVDFVMFVVISIRIH